MRPVNRITSAPCATGGYKAPASIFVVNDLIWDVAAGGQLYISLADGRVVCLGADAAETKTD
jgi:hypothetical protein